MTDNLNQQDDKSIPRPYDPDIIKGLTSSALPPKPNAQTQPSPKPKK